MTRSVQVLIAGAGPVGLSLALELNRQGVEVLVLDKAAEPTSQTESRALGVHTRTLEAFERMGVIDGVLAQGRRIDSAIIWKEADRELARIDLAKLDTPFPFILLLEQGRTEDILEAHARSLGITVLRDVELLSFRQEPSSFAPKTVRSVVRHADGRLEDIESDYLVGCDGAHSSVRSVLNVEFTGHAMPGRFALADARAAWGRSYDPHAMNMFFSPELIFGMLRDDYWRFVVELPDDLANRDGRLSQEDILGAVQLQIDTHGVAARVKDAIWTSDYRVSSRMVDKFRSGRVFLAGDAAHIHSPVSGQGMNGGIQDAINLAWKLALALKGRGGQALLDSYQAERRPALSATLRTTEQMASAFNMTSSVGIALRDAALGLLAGIGPMQTMMRNTFTGHALAYIDSPIVDQALKRRGIWRDANGSDLPGLIDAGVPPGERAPDARLSNDGARRLYQVWGGEPRHRLLVFPGHASAERQADLAEKATAFAVRWGEFVAVYRVGGDLPDHQPLVEAYGAQHEALYLIRPDGYVAFRAQPADFDALGTYLDRLLTEDAAFAGDDVIHPERLQASPSRPAGLEQAGSAS